MKNNCIAFVDGRMFLAYKGKYTYIFLAGTWTLKQKVEENGHKVTIRTSRK